MLKLKTLCNNYLEENFWLAKSTKDTTERAVRYFAEMIGNIEVDRLEYQHFEKYKNLLLKTGREKSTANMYIRAIHPVLTWAIKLKLIESDPMKGLKQFKITRRPIRIYENWEIERMLRYAPNLRWKAIILIARTTGWRRGEILNLNKNNIRDNSLWVEPKRDTENTWPWEPKDKEIRRVPISTELLSILRSLDCFYPALAKERYQNLIRLKKTLKYLPERVRRCPDQNFRRTFVNIQRRAFGRQIGDFHSLRKTFTTIMCEQLPDHFVMKLTGHNSLKTMTYYLSARESYYEQARIIASENIKSGMLGLQTARKEGVCDIPLSGRYQT